MHFFSAQIKIVKINYFLSVISFHVIFIFIRDSNEERESEIDGL